MSHPQAPPVTEVQAQVIEFYTKHMQEASVGWGRDKNGKFFAPFARLAEAAWISSQQQVTYG